MSYKRITLDIPLELMGQISPICGRFKEYPSRQVFLIEVIENHFKLLKNTDISIKENDLTIKEVSSEGKTLAEIYDEKNKKI